jgi:hypothetical protein
MAPKKRVDDADRPPEGEDERFLTIVLTGRVLTHAIFSLTVAGEEPLSTEPLQPGAFTAQIFSRRIQISPAFLEAFLVSPLTLQAVAADPKETVTTAKGAKPVKGGKTKGESDAPEEPAQKLGLWLINLSDLLSQKECIIDLLRNGGNSAFEKLTATCTSSDVLLAPANVLRYFPILVDVESASNIPPTTPLNLNHSMLPSDEVNGGKYDDVFVKCTFAKDEFTTEKWKHSSEIPFRFRKVVFGYKYKRFDLLESLFFQPVRFELHDRDVKSAKAAAPFGLATISLREALSSQLLFEDVTQIVPSREHGESGCCGDYISFCTTLRTRIQFLAPLPKISYIEEGSGPSSDPSFLARLIMVLPFRSDVTVLALKAIMGTLVQLPKAAKNGIVRAQEQAPPDGEIQTVTKDKKAPGGKEVVAAVIPPFNSGVSAIVPAGISGFELMDEEWRLMVIEGPAKQVQRVAQAAATVVGDHPQVRIRFNGELAIPQRWYHDFPPLVVPMEDPAKKELTQRSSAPDPPPDANKLGAKKMSIAKKNEKAEVAAAADKAEDSAEIDAGGVGGRIRRIRLGPLLTELVSKQRNFVKRNLPLECTRCITKLSLLRDAPSVLHAIEQNLFPTAVELISLERIHGNTLEILDVFGNEKFISFSSVDVASLPSAEAATEYAVERKKVTELTVSDNGEVFSFEATPATLIPVPKHKFRRFDHKLYMTVSSEKKEVLCAFPSAPPTQTLRYLVTAQVVVCDGEPLLFVLSASSLAKNSSDHHNPSFERKLRKDKLRAPASEYFKMLKQQQQSYDACHTKSGPPKYQDESSDDEEGFVDSAPENLQERIERTIVPNYVALNRTIDQAPLQSTSTAIDYDLCRKLYEERAPRQPPPPSMPSAVPFSTIQAKKACEDRTRNTGLSESRIDDLKQMWAPPGSYKGLKQGRNPLKFDGASEILDDPARHRSIFSDGLATDEEQRISREIAKEREEWKEKVVVEDTKFSVNARSYDKPTCAQQKVKPMLDGPPIKSSIKAAFVPTAPLSISEKFDIAVNTRVDRHKSKHPENAKFYYATSPKKHVSIKEVSEQEKAGPLW